MIESRPDDGLLVGHLENRIGAILRVGVHASTSCLAGGLLLALFTRDTTVAPWLMTVGLVVLMATPVLRVVVSIVEFAAHRDWMFFILTGIVLLELCAGVVAALVYHRRL
jgi:uncharacterized membrane protein